MYRPFPLKTRTLFWAKVNKRGPIPEHNPDLGACWMWLGRSIDSKGYGRFQSTGLRDTVNRISIGAHRFAFIDTKGDIPDGLVTDHLCRNRLCVNPDHIEPVTNRENVIRGVVFRLPPKAEREAMRRMLRRKGPPSIGNGRTACRRFGHPYTAENTYLSPKGVKQCRKCIEIRRAEYKATRRKP